MTHRTLITIGALLVSATLLAGCSSPTTPAAIPTTSATPTPTASGPVSAPKDEAEAIAAAEDAIDRLLTVYTEVDAAGGTNPEAFEAVAIGNALEDAKADAYRTAHGPILNEASESIEGQATVTGTLVFEQITAYGQEWQGIPNGLVIVPGCLDNSGRITTTADGQPAMKNPKPRNKVEFRVSYDAEREAWLVADRTSLGETC
jgi:outer membrane murein-binding lipoprotein Lpp